jgi:hypothetical protein
LPAAQHRDQDEVAAQRARVVAVVDVHRVEHVQRLRAHAGFFQQFTRGGGKHAFARVDLAAGKGPAALVRRVGALHQQHAAVAHDCCDGGGDGTLGRGRGHARFLFVAEAWVCQGTPTRP